MTMRAGVLLSGCGYLDGSEIHEAVLTMLHLDRAGAEVICIAPRGQQRDVVDHATGKEAVGQVRDIMEESARIARGRIRDLATVHARDLDVVVLPGGFGAAKNLCDFAVAGEQATVHTEVARLLREMHAAGKPIGAACIAPALVAALFGTELHPVVTIGSDKATASALHAMGARHQDSAVTAAVVDERNRIVTTPAYMCRARISEVSRGIEDMVQQVLRLASAQGSAAGAAR